MAVRSAMHQAGASALTELLQFPTPDAARRNIPCACGHQARDQELRSKPVLSAVGKSAVSRPYYLCLHCHNGQFPADVELTSRTRRSPLGFVACRRSWAKGCPSTMGASR